MKHTYLIKKLQPLFFLLLALSHVNAHAQHAEEHGHVALIPNPTLSLSDVVEQAILNQPNWQELEARRQQDEAWSGVSKSFISGQAVMTVNYLGDQVFNSIGEREVQVGVAFPLWWPGQKQNGSELAASMSMETEQWERALAWSVAGEIRRQLADIGLAQARLAASHEALEHSEHLLELSLAMQDAGEISEHDVMLVRSQVLEARSAEFEADAILVDSRRQYAVFTGLSEIPATALDETQTSDDEITLEHPLLSSLNAQLERARGQTEREAQASRGSPSLTIGARRQRGDRLTENNSALALGISIPLGGKTFTKAKVADFRRSETDIEVAMFQEKRRLEMLVHEVEHEQTVMRQRLSLAEENAELSLIRWNMSRTAWELGENSMPEVILALKQSREAQLQLLTIQIQQKALVSAFNQTLGIMP